MGVIQQHPGVDVAGLNGLTSTVISGDEAQVLAMAEHFSERGRKIKRLHVSHAFHSHHMDPMLREFGEVAASVTYHPPEIRIVSNLTGKPADAGELCRPEYWVSHVRSAVRFSAGVVALQDEGVTACLEIGPHGVLSAMALGCVDEDRMIPAFIPMMRKESPEAETLAHALGGLHNHGVSLQWQEIFDSSDARLCVLPNYAFQRVEYWPKPVVNAARREQAGRFSLSGSRTDVPGGAVYTVDFGPETHPFLEQHVIYGQVVVPGAFYMATFLAIAEARWPDQTISFFCTSSEHDNGHIRFTAQGTTDIQPVHTGEHQIKHKQIGLFTACHGQTALSITSDQYAIIILFKIITRKTGYFGFVFDD